MTDELKPVRCGCGGEAFHNTARGWNPVREDALVVWHRVICKNCGTQTKAFYTEAEAIQAWNRAMGTDARTLMKVFAYDATCAVCEKKKERTAKVIEHDGVVTMDGKKYHHMEYLCENCKKKVLGGDSYCSHCGCRLDWNEDIPMEYFESGGI